MISTTTGEPGAHRRHDQSPSCYYRGYICSSLWARTFTVPVAAWRQIRVKPRKLHACQCDTAVYFRLFFDIPDERRIIRSSLFIARPFPSHAIVSTLTIYISRVGESAKRFLAPGTRDWKPASCAGGRENSVVL